MKLPLEQYKKLQRFANFLISEDHESIDWTSYVYDYGLMDTPYGPNSHGRNIDGIESFRDVVSFLELIMETTLEKINFSKYMSCHDCTGNGSLTTLFYPESLTMKFVLDVETTVTHEYSWEKTFEEVVNFRSEYYGERYDNLKKLGNPEFVKKSMNELGPELEVNYDGGGDSGYIEDNVPEVFMDISFEILSAYFGGWEINEGSKGVITYDFKNKKIRANHDLFENEGFDVDVFEIDFTK